MCGPLRAAGAFSVFCLLVACTRARAYRLSLRARQPSLHSTVHYQRPACLAAGTAAAAMSEPPSQQLAPHAHDTPPISAAPPPQPPSQPPSAYRPVIVLRHADGAQVRAHTGAANGTGTPSRTRTGSGAKVVVTKQSTSAGNRTAAWLSSTVPTARDDAALLPISGAKSSTVLDPFSKTTHCCTYALPLRVPLLDTERRFEQRQHTASHTTGGINRSASAAIGAYYSVHAMHLHLRRAYDAHEVAASAPAHAGTSTTGGGAPDGTGSGTSGSSASASRAALAMAGTVEGAPAAVALLNATLQAHLAASLMAARLHVRAARSRAACVPELDASRAALSMQARFEYYIWGAGNRDCPSMHGHSIPAAVVLRIAELASHAGARELLSELARHALCQAAAALEQRPAAPGRAGSPLVDPLHPPNAFHPLSLLQELADDFTAAQRTASVAYALRNPVEAERLLFFHDAAPLLAKLPATAAATVAVPHLIATAARASCIHPTLAQTSQAVARTSGTWYLANEDTLSLYPSASLPVFLPKPAATASAAAAGEGVPQLLLFSPSVGLRCHDMDEACGGSTCLLFEPPRAQTSGIQRGMVCRMRTFLQVRLTRTSGYLQSVNDMWHRRKALQVRLLVVPTSHFAAAAQLRADASSGAALSLEQPADSALLPAAGSGAVNVDNFCAAQLSHANRVSTALQAFWVAEADALLVNFTRMLTSMAADLMLAAAPPPDMLSAFSAARTTTTPLPGLGAPDAREDSATEYDIFAIAKVESPFSIPPSVRAQLQSDVMLQRLMRRTIRAYADGLQRQRDLETRQSAAAAAHAVELEAGGVRPISRGSMTPASGGRVGADAHRPMSGSKIGRIFVNAPTSPREGGAVLSRASVAGAHARHDAADAMLPLSPTALAELLTLPSVAQRIAHMFGVSFRTDLHTVAEWWHAMYADEPPKSDLRTTSDVFAEEHVTTTFDASASRPSAAHAETGALTRTVALSDTQRSASDSRSPARFASRPASAVRRIVRPSTAIRPVSASTPGKATRPSSASYATVDIDTRSGHTRRRGDTGDAGLAHSGAVVPPSMAAHMPPIVENSASAPSAENLELVYAQVASSALPSHLPPPFRAALSQTMNALMSAQLRQLSMQSLADVLAFFMRFAVRRQRRHLQTLCNVYGLREQLAMRANDDAADYAASLHAKALAEAQQRAAIRSAVAARKREFERKHSSNKLLRNRRSPRGIPVGAADAAPASPLVSSSLVAALTLGARPMAAHEDGGNDASRSVVVSPSPRPPPPRPSSSRPVPPASPAPDAAGSLLPSRLRLFVSPQSTSQSTRAPALDVDDDAMTGGPSEEGKVTATPSASIMWLQASPATASRQGSHDSSARRRKTAVARATDTISSLLAELLHVPMTTTGPSVSGAEGGAGSEARMMSPIFHRGGRRASLATITIPSLDTVIEAADEEARVLANEMQNACGPCFMTLLQDAARADNWPTAVGMLSEWDDGDSTKRHPRVELPEALPSPQPALQDVLPQSLIADIIRPAFAATLVINPAFIQQQYALARGSQAFVTPLLHARRLRMLRGQLLQTVNRSNAPNADKEEVLLSPAQVIALKS
ncbi:hypothetical protein EON66_00265 [archaeon]|nr:MAG: hypothetical protein EON66_00265 [archaeon]